MRFNVRRYLGNLLLTVDISANSLLGGAPDETLSSRLGRWKDSRKRYQRWIAAPFAWALDHIDKGHVDGAEKHEREIIHRPEALDDEPDD